MDFKQAVAIEVTKASPPVTVGALTLFGFPMSDWVLAVTALYTLLQMFFLLRDKWWREREPKG